MSLILNNIADLPQSGMSSRHERHSYLSRDDDRGEHRSVKDTRTIGSAYDRYLQSAQYLSFPSGEASALGGARSGRGVSGGMAGIPVADGVSGRPGIIGRDMVSNGPSRDLDDRLPVETMARPGRETLPLPPDASNTLYVEGLPPDTTRREVAHIFRPFVGYKEVRLVSKESKQRGGDPLILCFVDFASPACAATAMSALQGDYSFFS
ncbi:RNA-binding protein 2-like [Pistacia vera]|uniref:RNA-binding protein 2-like n=1 Tax=Pistacia vera TaxID=55513 RepID=UPI001263A038|nr:RNA-binding protein 2-like [Pistacia vera]